MMNVGTIINKSIGMKIAKPVFLNNVEHKIPIASNGINVINPIKKIKPPIEIISIIYIELTKNSPLKVNEIEDGTIIIITITINAKILPQRYSHRLTGLLKNQDRDPFLFSPIILLEAKAIVKATPKYKR